MNIREAVTRALEKLGIASPSETWREVVKIDPSITLSDVNFELYHGTRDPKNPVYKKLRKGSARYKAFEINMSIEYGEWYIMRLASFCG